MVPSNRCPQSQNLLEAMLQGQVELMPDVVELSLDVVEILGLGGPSIVPVSGTSRYFRRHRSTRRKCYKASKGINL